MWILSVAVAFSFPGCLLIAYCGFFGLWVCCEFWFLGSLDLQCVGDRLLSGLGSWIGAIYYLRFWQVLRWWVCAALGVFCFVWWFLGYFGGLITGVIWFYLVFALRKGFGWLFEFGLYWCFWFSGVGLRNVVAGLARC